MVLCVYQIVVLQILSIHLTNVNNAHKNAKLVTLQDAFLVLTLVNICQDKIV